MAEQIGWQTILATALVTSFFTACVTEPVKAVIQSWLKRRQLRRAIYHELAHNFGVLRAQVDYGRQWADHVGFIGRGFGMEFRRLAYDSALKEPSLFYKLGHNEIYWLTLMYRDWQNVVDKVFEDDQQRIANAQFCARSVLHHMKNRHISKRLMFRVSGHWMRCHFRAHLPNERYLSMTDFMEQHFWRRIDTLQYWIWRWVYRVPPAVNTEL